MKTPAVTTRPASSSDRDFLLQVFARSDDSRAWLLQIDARLIQMQFTAQQVSYSSRFPAAVHDIILIDGQPAGQVRWAELDDEVRVIDIALLPEYRRQGAGATVYHAIMGRAAAAGKPVCASVARDNAGSIVFHTRLGFTIESGTDTHYLVTAAPAPAESVRPRS